MPVVLSSCASRMEMKVLINTWNKRSEGSRIGVKKFKQEHGHC
jgi:hypothetical protein